MKLISNTLHPKTADLYLTLGTPQKPSLLQTGPPRTVLTCLYGPRNNSGGRPDYDRRPAICGATPTTTVTTLVTWVRRTAMTVVLMSDRLWGKVPLVSHAGKVHL